MHNGTNGRMRDEGERDHEQAEQAADPHDALPAAEAAGDRHGNQSEHPQRGGDQCFHLEYMARLHQKSRGRGPIFHESSPLKR